MAPSFREIEVASRPRKRVAGRGVPVADAEAPPEGVDIEFLGEVIGYPLRRAQVAVFTDYARTVGELDIRPAQFSALVVIGANQGLTQSAIAATLGIDRSATVGLLDSLEERGLLVRVPSQVDRRSNAIVLTAAGHDMLEAVKQKVREHDRRMTSGMTADERATLLRLLHKLY